MGKLIKLKPAPQPTESRGHRFWGCPFYNSCLDFAARRDWSSFTCSGCPNLALVPAYKTVRFIMPYWRVLSEVHPEFKEKYEPLMNLFHENPGNETAH